MPAPSQPPTTFILIHGAWHGAWAFAALIPELEKLGHRCVAIDLPGHGADAKFPAGYEPRDQDEFLQAKSPVAKLKQADYSAVVNSEIDKLEGSGPLVLVGHSLGGTTVSSVAEARPADLAHIVYLSAFLTAGASVFSMFGRPSAANSLVPPLNVIGDDAMRLGATRMDPRSADPQYLELVRQCFYADLTDAQVQYAFANLIPDEATLPQESPVVTTPERWGIVTRHYIRTLKDQAAPPPLQVDMINLADQLAPAKPTIQHEIDTSHSSFLAKPVELARILDGIANMTGC